MELCHEKSTQSLQNLSENSIAPIDNEQELNCHIGKTPKFYFYGPSPFPGAFKNSFANSSMTSTPFRFLKHVLPSQVKHIKALLARRHDSIKPNEATIPEESECDIGIRILV
ncbi:Calcium/calmodulin-dependent serine/threonine-protein kinase 1 [Capsicum baccatum]|uniref:Calcium/calmodulin-dependent serine/threonine-protein kinase 1 n=1 Tax=Capsicum baccatum TaxID=33114 RepID=A0A2G2V157_CAPBA|nr:Calcium/calmodulin-dependent serine/threonine-protein kinase 1 [Capsicum baccatum]